VKGKIASSSLLAVALAIGGSTAMAQTPAQIQAEVQKALSNSKYEGVHGSVQDNGLVVLNGSVDVFDLTKLTTRFIESRASRQSRTTSRSRDRQFRIKN
jgi:hypothetical protein